MITSRIEHWDGSLSTLYDDISSSDTDDTDDTDESLLTRVTKRIQHYLVNRSCHNYVGYDNTELIPKTQNTVYFRKTTSISTLYRSMYEYTSPTTNKQYLVKVRTVEDDIEPVEEQKTKYTLLEGKLFVEGHEMESMVYGTLTGESCISKRVAWKDVVPKNQTCGVLTINDQTVVLDFSDWANTIDFEYKHYTVIVMQKKPNVITLYDYIDEIYHSCMSPLEISKHLGMVVRNIIGKINYLNEKYSFVHCDLKLDNVLVNSNDPTDITLIDFDLSSVGDFVSNSQLFYSNPESLLSVSQTKHGVLFDVYRLCTSVILTAHVPLFNTNRYFSKLHSILCTTPNDPRVIKLEGVDSQYNFLNDMFYFKKWYVLVDYTKLIMFLTRGVENKQSDVSTVLITMEDPKEDRTDKKKDTEQTDGSTISKRNTIDIDVSPQVNSLHGSGLFV